MSGYTDADLARFVVDPGRAARPPFLRDRARIVHSVGLRRLAAKTQVVGPDSNDFIRNRLTHTLEVAQIGRELAMDIGCDPDLVEAACLAHDLGHPPFGHNGERALDDAASDIGGFEGNAQTFRLLTRLEAKAMAPDGTSAGLNLTRATLDAASKYPWARDDARQPAGSETDGSPRSIRKFGVYADDRTTFDWMREPAVPLVTCVEAQVMDFADDVAYSVHDVEDGIASGSIALQLLEDAGQRREIYRTAREWYAPAMTADEFGAAFTRLSGLAAWPTGSYEGTRQQLAGLKNLTSRLINRFCRSVSGTAEAAGTLGLLRRYTGYVEVPAATTAEIVVLKAIAAELVMRTADRLAAMTRQRTVLAELTERIWQTAPAGLEPAFRGDYARAVDDAAARRVVIDQVASLTDLSAVEKLKRLTTGPA